MYLRGYTRCVLCQGAPERAEEQQARALGIAAEVVGDVATPGTCSPL
ncbi:hypothetical protein WME73_12220 [Sorangium sp. So ce302]